MKIDAVHIYTLNVAFTHPTVVQLGKIESAQNVVVKIQTDQGLYGWGESSPFAPITGDSQASNLKTAQALGQLIKGKSPLAIQTRMADINRFTVGEPSIRSAFDMALYDIAAKAAAMPLYQFLGGERRPLRTDLTIGMKETVEETLTFAQDILDQGFDAIKMKVGRSGLADVDHVRAVRELAGPDIQIKIDESGRTSRSQGDAGPVASRDREIRSGHVKPRATTTRAAEDASDGVGDGRSAHRSPFQLPA